MNNSNQPSEIKNERILPVQSQSSQTVAYLTACQLTISHPGSSDWSPKLSQLPWSYWTQIRPTFANSVDPDQLASEEANWSGSALFGIKYVKLYQQPESRNLIGWKLKVGMPSFLFSMAKINIQIPMTLYCAWPKTWQLHFPTCWYA